MIHINYGNVIKKLASCFDLDYTLIKTNQKSYFY